MDNPCVHSCKGLCNALKTAELREEESIREYTRFADACDYPEVQSILQELIAGRQRGLEQLRRAREIIGVRFAATDDISDSYA
jgi:hypothetical protein